MYRLRSFFSTLALLTLCVGFRASAHAQADLPIYDDSFRNGWDFWSGWSPADIASTAVVHSGATSCAVTSGPWQGFQFGHSPFTTTGYGKLSFWINGGSTGGQILSVNGTLNYNAQAGVTIGPLAANTWQHIEIPLASLGVADSSNLTSFWLQEFSGSNMTAPTYYVDDIMLTGSVPTIPPPPLNGAMAVYDDALTNGWQNWSWNTIVGTETTRVNSGASSMAVTLNGGGLSLHHDNLDTQNYPSLTFWINGGATGGQLLAVNIERNDGVRPAVALPALAADTWQKMTLSLADLGGANITDLNRITFREVNGGSAATFYLDDMRLDLAPPPAVVNVKINSKQVLQKVDARIFGLNTAIWDGSFNTATTAELLVEADNQALRFPGGSISDIYHWKTNTSDGETWTWQTGFDAFAHIATTTQAQVYITVNYGTGTPQEAAEWVQYSNQTKGYGFKYWEVGNENYGTWEADNNNRPHDPVTYATRFVDYMARMKAMDSTIKVGAVIQTSEDGDANYHDQTVINPRTGLPHDGWSAVMLATFKQLGVYPDFVVYHRYEQGPGGESDAYLLNASKGWAGDAMKIRQLLTDYLGANGAAVEINCTENNSVYGNPGKQTTSLVNGLFFADSIGNILKTEFKSLFWWDLRNGQETGNNNSPSLYGWRPYGDYGVVTYNTLAGPADRYPTFYVYKLLQYFARGGEDVLATTSDYNGLGVYAVREQNKNIRVLLINKHPTATLNASITVDGFNVGRVGDVYSYGIPQDEAARTGTGSADIEHTTKTLGSRSFTFNPGPYSATVIRVDGDQGQNETAPNSTPAKK